MRSYPIGNGSVSARIPREVAALLDTMQLEGSNTDALLALADEDWHRLLEFCDLAHVALPLSQVNGKGFPQWVRTRLEENVRDNAKRFERVKAAYAEAASALQRAGVQHVVLKGFTQIPDFVNDGSLRNQSDIDIYCQHQHLERARHALTAIGYRPDGEQDMRADHLAPLSRAGGWTWRGNTYDPEMPPNIELHFCLWNARVSMIEIPEVEGFWARRITRRLGGMEFHALHPVDQLGYFALHILRGMMSGDWVIHHVLELATFLHNRARDVEFWSQWRELHSATLRQLETLAFTLARNWFSCAVAEVVRVELDRLPASRQQWLRRFGGAPLEVMFRRNKDGKLLQALLIGSRIARRSVLRRAIFPARLPGPDAPRARFRYRRPLGNANTGRITVYLQFLVRAALANATANVSFLLHGATLWLSKRALNSQFWVFLAVSFFLTWGSQPISSSSISS